jgi:hypothetical protein
VIQAPKVELDYGVSLNANRLTKWFRAAYLMGRAKRGVSAEFLQRELDVAYQTAWTMRTSCATG